MLSAVEDMVFVSGIDILATVTFAIPVIEKEPVD
jgi:hypothetical protein